MRLINATYFRSESVTTLISNSMYYQCEAFLMIEFKGKNIFIHDAHYRFKENKIIVL